MIFDLGLGVEGKSFRSKPHHYGKRKNITIDSLAFNKFIRAFSPCKAVEEALGKLNLSGFVTDTD